MVTIIYLCKFVTDYLKPVKKNESELRALEIFAKIRDALVDIN